MSTVQNAKATEEHLKQVTACNYQDLKLTIQLNLNIGLYKHTTLPFIQGLFYKTLQLICA